MKILIVASKWLPEYTGPGVRIPRLYQAIGKDIGASDIKILCGSIEFPQSGVYMHQGLEVHRIVCPYIQARQFPLNILPKRFYDFIASIVDNVIGLWALRRFKSVDLLHVVGTSGITASALLWARLRGIPVIQELVTAKASPAQRFLGVFKVKPPCNSVIITMRHDVRARAVELGFDHQIWHRPNPFDQTRFFPVSAEEKQRLREQVSPFGADDIVLCSVAKIIPQKNQIFLLEVMRHLDAKYKLIIAGPKVTQGPLYARDQAYLEQIYRNIETYQLRGRVHIHTDYVQAHLYMKASDIYMLPAYDEGFGTPMMEAIACGIPVIANKDEASFAEWLNEGQNGFLRPLVASEWAAACDLATQMPRENRLAQAKNIVDLAGQDHIYAEYIRKIGGLTGYNRNPDQELNKYVAAL